MKCCKVLQPWPEFLAQQKDTRFGTWNVRRLCRVGAIKSIVGELQKYKLDLGEYKRLGGKGRDIK
jgi:hypothetical protein